MDLPLEHYRRRNQYQAYPTRLQSRDETAIKEYLAESNHKSAVAGFRASVAFVHGITGYRFTDGYLLLQALYGDQASENPHQRLCEPDRPLDPSTLGDVAPLENQHAKEEVAVCELDRLLTVPTLVALSKELHAKKKAAASGLGRALAASTLDDIALPKLPPTTKEVAAYEPDRLRLIVAPRELDRLIAF
jgi:hypothetical protein